MPVRINGLNTGSVTLSASANGGDVTLNLPNANGTVATTSYADTAPGLQYITGQTFTAVTSVSVNNCFTSTYAHYKIIFTMSSKSDTSNMRIRLRVSGTDNSSSNYYFNGAEAASDTATTIGATRSNGLATSFILGPIGSGPGASDVTLYNPFASEATFLNASTVCQYDSNIMVRFMGGRMTVTTSYDGFTLFPDTGTVTGTVRVYGYRSS